MSKSDRQPTVTSTNDQPGRKRESIKPDAQTTWTWPTIRSGDCQMTEATISLSSDGTASFSAIITSSDEGDVWEVLSIAMLDVHGLELFRLGQFDSLPVAVVGEQFGIESTQYFPGYIYPFVASLTMTNHC